MPGSPPRPKPNRSGLDATRRAACAWAIRRQCFAAPALPMAWRRPCFPGQSRGQAMTPLRDIDFVFFDIGGTRGDYDPPAGHLVPLPGSAALLQAVRDQVGARIGVITNLASLSNARAHALLEEAGLATFLDPDGFVSQHHARVAKPDPKIYQLAAS